jgi:hypothetical protein
MTKITLSSLLILLSLSFANAQIARYDQVNFRHHIDNQNFITGESSPMIYASRSGGNILGGSQSLILQSGGTSNDRHIFLRTRNETRLFIHNNGNIGIGTTSTGNYRLNVWGSVRAHEIVVNTSGADFVFEENYTLRPLHEVEAFIKANKHLPEIPSAKEMQEEGVGVSELQTKLLQKIEESTLYMIEQNKQLHELKNENIEIRKENQELSKENKEIKASIEKLK